MRPFFLFLAMYPLRVGGVILLLWERLGGIPIGRDIRG